MRWTRVDRSPLWGDRLDSSKAGPLRYLLAPLLLYELVCYTWRQDVTEKKARPWIWREKLQARWRYVQALLCYLGPPSHLFWNILPMSAWVLAVTLGVIFFEKYTGRVLDPGNVSYRAYRSVQFVVSLLLSMRINRGVTRWWDARNGFRGAGSAVAALCYQCPVWGVDPAIHACIRKWGIAWHFALWAELNGDKRLDPRAEALFDEEGLRDYYSYSKGRHLCANMLRRLIQEAVEVHTGGMRQEMFTELQSSLQRGFDSMSQCNRISQQALPEALTMLSSGFLSIWLLVMPLGLWESSAGPVGAFVMMLVAVLMLACDELATQLENPRAWPEGLRWKLLPVEVTLQRTLKAAGSSHLNLGMVNAVRERERAKMAAEAEELKGLGSAQNGLSAHIAAGKGEV
ncbi:deoxyribodipyrimidine photo-lyase [Chlorella sorokiniana]|uniref:Deoxyribodipyrimidine photo-lyase n=1 Tax=Chlorella sorokiniana TaxID=3076 RepID=A0A2P6TRI7_CHLSO|nr:deoxyribodipyrimidine photo-lyase [Chlorella sorokiniana]|eukprot:PRW56677.1 deoxyribodipyrimidine photo-lyase [Chlorella sorokiniana]